MAVTETSTQGAPDIMMVTAIKPRRDAIMIGDDIKIVITRASTGQVHVGIQAPKELKITRVSNEMPEEKED